MKYSAKIQPERPMPDTQAESRHRQDPGDTRRGPGVRYGADPASASLTSANDGPEPSPSDGVP